MQISDKINTEMMILNV